MSDREGPRVGLMELVVAAGGSVLAHVVQESNLITVVVFLVLAGIAAEIRARKKASSEDASRPESSRKGATGGTELARRLKNLARSEADKFQATFVPQLEANAVVNVLSPGLVDDQESITLRNAAIPSDVSVAVSQLCDRPIIISVIGPSGVGKSTFLLSVVQRTIGTPLAMLQAPSLAEATRWRARLGRLVAKLRGEPVEIQWLAWALHRTYGVPRSFATEFLYENPRVTLLIDGLDQVDDSNRIELLRRLRDLRSVSQYGGAIIIAGREIAATHVAENAEPDISVHLRAYHRGQLRERLMTNQQLENASYSPVLQRLRALVTDEPRALDLIESPWRATVLAAVSGQRGASASRIHYSNLLELFEMTSVADMFPLDAIDELSRFRRRARRLAMFMRKRGLPRFHLLQDAEAGRGSWSFIAAYLLALFIVLLAPSLTRTWVTVAQAAIPYASSLSTWAWVPTTPQKWMWTLTLGLFYWTLGYEQVVRMEWSNLLSAREWLFSAVFLVPMYGWLLWFRPSTEPGLFKAQLALVPTILILMIATEVETRTPQSLRAVLRSRVRMAVKLFGILWFAGSASILLLYPYSFVTIGEMLIVGGEVVEAPRWQVYGWAGLYDVVTVALGGAIMVPFGLVFPLFVGVLVRRVSLVVVCQLPLCLGTFCSQLVRSGIFYDRVTGIAPAHDELWDHLLTTWPTRWVAPRDVVERVGDER